MIRFLAPFDAVDAVSLGMSMHSESRFSRLAFDYTKAVAWASTFGTGSSVALGAFDRGLVGMIVGQCGTTLPYTNECVAQEQLFYILPQFRSPKLAFGLARGFIDECKRRGALDIVFSNGTGYDPDRVGKLFERCGLARVGGVYAMEV